MKWMATPKNWKNQGHGEVIKVGGVKPHADASDITFLLQDKRVEGLNNGQWFRAPTSPHAHLINVGYQVI